MGQPKGYHPPHHWKKGESGNPGGRPKGSTDVRSFKDILDKIGKEDLINSPIVPLKIKRKFYSMSPITKKEAVMHLVYLSAMERKDWAVRYIADYSEGKPKEFHEITKKNVTVDIDDEKNVKITEGDEIGTDEETIVTSSDNNNK